MKSKISTIIAHEFTSKIKSKGFIIGTFLGPLILILFGLGMGYIMSSVGETEKQLAIYDQTNSIGSLLVQSDSTKYFVSNKNLDELKEDLLDSKIDGYVIINDSIIENGNVVCYTRGGGGIGFVATLNRNLESILLQIRLEKTEIPAETISYINKGVKVETIKINEQGESEKDDTAIMSAVGYALGIVMYILVLLYGGMVSRGVIEEKANRIVEVIASSVRPYDIMMGKIIGIGAVGLAQIAIWGILFSIATYIGLDLFSNELMGGDPQAMAQSMGADAPNMEQLAQSTGISSILPNFSFMLIIGFIFYFLFGYFIYASLFAALGSAVDNEQDAAMMQTPLMIPIIFTVFFIPAVLSEPDSTLAIVLSIFPLTSPILMMVRQASTNVPFWQSSLSVIVLVVGFLVSVWFSAKIYRVGILSTGKKASFADLYKWLKY